MVYFISNGTYVKIGKSTNVKKRLLSLQTGSSARLILLHEIQGGVELEGKCHYIFNEYRIFGEWFNLPVEFYTITEETVLAKWEELKRYHKNKKFNLAISSIWHKERQELPKGMIYINSEVGALLGMTKAVIIEHFYVSNPHNNKVKFNISNLSRELPISLSTAQRSIKELVEENFLIKHSRSVYSFSANFFATFEEYKQKAIDL